MSPALLDVIAQKIFNEEYKLQSSVLSSLLGSNILLSISFSKTLNIFSFFSVRDKISHLYETTERIIISVSVFCYLRFQTKKGRHGILNWVVNISFEFNATELL